MIPTTTPTPRLAPRPVRPDVPFGPRPAAFSRQPRRMPLPARKHCKGPSSAEPDNSLPSQPKGIAREGAAASLPLHSSPFTLHSSSRPAFTLTELLVVITIIGMLAGMTLTALSAARESARVARTQATITKLDRIVQARYEEFASRRVPFPSNVRSVPGNLPLPTNARVRFFAEARLRALRQLQQWEMPDKSEDIANPRTAGNDAFVPEDIDVPWMFQQSTGGVTWTVQMPRTALARTLFRRCAAQPTTPIPSPGPPPVPGPTPAEENAATAEILYLWLTTGDREVVEQFQANEIGDTDGDGYREFIDAWGEPIRFIRWPTCFYTESELMTGDPDEDHDPLDTRRFDPSAYRLVPLIYSKGPDKEPGIRIDEGATSYEYIYDETREVGKPDGTNTHYDNITNHALGMN